MNRYTLFFLLLGFYLILNINVEGQVISVEESTTRINEMRLSGSKTRVEGDSRDVELFLKQQLRELGKVRDRNTYLEISDVTLSGDEYGERIFYAEIKGNETVRTVWFGADTEGLSELGVKLLTDKLNQFMYDFAIGFYKNEVQKEIDESEKAENYAIRQQRRLERDSVSLLNSLESNEEQLIKLQQAIEDNKLEHERLLLQIEQNKLALDSADITLYRIREVILKQKKKKESIK